MHIYPIQTHVVTADEKIENIIRSNITALPNNSVLVISSKILAITQGDVADISADKHALIQQESEYYLPNEYNKFGANITITGHKLVSAAGIDESNVDGVYVLLPSRVQETANALRKFCLDSFNTQNIAVIITDSRSLPLNIGTYSDAIAYSGMRAVRDYRGTADLFGRKFKAERQNLITSFATAANLVMGEGSESCPIAIISDVPESIFTNNDPTANELQMYYYDKKDDVFAGLLDADLWQKGGGGYLARQ